MVRLAGIEPTTLGFGGSDFPLDFDVSQSVFPMVLWGAEGCLSGFRKTHRSTQQHVSLFNQTLSEHQDVEVHSHVF